MKLKNVNMLSGSITRGMISMTIPIMIMNIMNTLFNIIDMAALRFFSDDGAVGAVGACGMLITLCTSLLIGTSIGANIIVAKRIGQGDRKKTESAVMTSLLISLVGGLALLVIGVMFSETFLKLTNCPNELLPRATKYFEIYFYGLPFLMFYNFCASILRAMGDTKRPMYFMILGGVIKVVFTVLFVSSFNLDVEGVAFATIIANLTASGLAFLTILKAKDPFKISLKKISFDFTDFKEILKIGAPTGVHSAMFAFMNVLITAAVNSFGKDATTGIAIANQYDTILYHICYAPSLAVTPYIAQNVGAKNIKRVKQTFVRTLMITTAFGVGFGIIGIAISKQLALTMSSTPAVIEFAQQKMLITFSTYFICGIQDVLGGVLRGLGKPLIPTLVTLFTVCPLRIVWVYFIFPLFPNMTLLYAVCSIEWALTSTIQFIIYRNIFSNKEGKSRCGLKPSVKH